MIVLLTAQEIVGGGNDSTRQINEIVSPTTPDNAKEEMFTSGGTKGGMYLYSYITVWSNAWVGGVKY